MDLSNIIEATISFTREHEKWAPVIVFALGLVESLALLSLLVPSTIILLGIGGLFGASGLPFWPLRVSGGIGACVGYTLSYWVGRHFHEPILRNWPFSRYPAMVERSERFFERYGVFSVFLGHFFGPVRAVIPVVAGVAGMTEFRFQLANIPSGFLWAFLVIAPGYFSTQSDQMKPFWDSVKSLAGS